MGFVMPTPARRAGPHSPGLSAQPRLRLAAADNLSYVKLTSADPHSADSQELLRFLDAASQASAVSWV